jgi:hypothetical protein
MDKGDKTLRQEAFKALGTTDTFIVDTGKGRNKK